MHTFHKYTSYLKHNWMRLSVVIGSIFLLISGLFLSVALFARQPRAEAITPSDTTTVSEAAEPKRGTLTDLYAVSIDNHVDARPASGISAASIVYELPVEGGITRFLAVFQKTTEVPEIGPVRSVRPYFLDTVLGLGPSFLGHFGGSPDALDRIKGSSTLSKLDADGMGNAGGSYWRDGRRMAPHNAYTSWTLASKWFEKRAGKTSTVETWMTLPDPASDARGPGAKIAIPFSPGSYTPEWRYDAEKNSYTRYQGGKAELDRLERKIETKNILIAYTDVSVLDEKGRVKVRTTGSGKGLVVRNGEALEATWKRQTNNEIVRFYDAEGKEIVLTEGSVWVEIVPKEIQVQQSLVK